MLDKFKQALRAKTPVGDTREGTTGHSANLLVWWHTEFTPEEQSYILARYKPMVMGGAGDSNLDPIIRPDGSLGLISSLAVLSTWFLSEDDIPLARRILAKSVERQESETGSFVDRHFIYGHMLKVYYRDRNRDGNALALAIQTCEKQIAIAPQVIREMKKEIMWDGHLPAHGGYTQLAIILERNKDYESTIRLSQEALRQGWAGDWEKRMARCKQRSNR